MHFNLKLALLVLLRYLPLRVDTARVVALVKDTSPDVSLDLFGVTGIVPDMSPSYRDADEEVEAWKEVKSEILQRLVAVKSGSVENFCWVSHEEVLDGSGLIVKGGLVVVVQKQATFRVNFYRMQEFRNWVRRKPLDIGSNMLFADEPDVWVVRLTDDSRGSHQPLQELAGGLPSPAEIQLQRSMRASTVLSPSFLTNFPLPSTRESTLVPALIPQGSEMFSFKLASGGRFVRSRHKWSWYLSDVYFGNGLPSFSYTQNDETGLLALQADRAHFSLDAPWIVSDANARLLFFINRCDSGLTHEVIDDTNHTLFTIRTDRERRHLFWSRSVSMSISLRDSYTLLYKGVKEHRFHGVSMLIYRGSDTLLMDPVAKIKYYGVSSRIKTIHVYASADTVLLLAASALSQL
eukprot:TRINITY_DN18482_c0_g1_i1.p1 TRINITY_DN18482_c0_g1~~TRINITY_DN18482_c0_g1_i1.p1  ORF type:complete len:406 (+),score=39.42 TRINITY_DN18482_c0_g1_i1:67-1284(+)